MTSIPVAIGRIYGILITISNAIISQTKDFFWIFYCISEMCMKFLSIFKKKMSILA